MAPLQFQQAVMGRDDWPFAQFHSESLWPVKNSAKAKRIKVDSNVKTLKTFRKALKKPTNTSTFTVQVLYF